MDRDIYCYDTDRLVNTLIEDMKAAAEGGQWPLSSYTPFRERPGFPGFEEYSFEEVRYMYYEACKEGDAAYRQFKEEWKLIVQKVANRIQELQNPTPELINILKRIYMEKRREFVFGTPSECFPTANGTIFPSTAPFSGNIYGKPDFSQNTSSAFANSFPVQQNLSVNTTSKKEESPIEQVCQSQSVGQQKSILKKSQILQESTNDSTSVFNMEEITSELSKLHKDHLVHIITKKSLPNSVIATDKLRKLLAETSMKDSKVTFSDTSSDSMNKDSEFKLLQMELNCTKRIVTELERTVKNQETIINLLKQGNESNGGDNKSYRFASTSQSNQTDHIVMKNQNKANNSIVRNSGVKKTAEIATKKEDGQTEGRSTDGGHKNDNVVKNPEGKKIENIAASSPHKNDKVAKENKGKKTDNIEYVESKEKKPGDIAKECEEKRLDSVANRSLNNNADCGSTREIYCWGGPQTFSKTVCDKTPTTKLFDVPDTLPLNTKNNSDPALKERTKITYGRNGKIKFGVGAKRAWIHLGKVTPGTTTEEIGAHLEEHFPGREFVVEKFRSGEDTKSVSFKIGTDISLKDELHNEMLWPNGVTVRTIQVIS